jgi:outer membrane protein assembly factor BamB
VRWVFEADDWISSSPVIGPDATVYVGSWDNNLYAIDPLTGVEIWHFETGNLIFSSPAVALDQ